MLDVDALSVSYGKQQAVADVSVQVDSGQAVAIVGVNGAGKSTTLNAIFGLVRKRSGHVSYNGMDLTAARPEEIARAGIGYVPEGRRIFQTLSVRENLQLVIVPRVEFPERLDAMLDRFPILADRIDTPAWTLSGGEQQQLAVARALMARPTLLILDEPSLGLAPQMVDRVFAAVRELHEGGISVLLVEQHAYRAVDLVEKVYVMQKGTLSDVVSAGELTITNSLWSSTNGRLSQSRS